MHQKTMLLLRKRAVISHGMAQDFDGKSTLASQHLSLLTFLQNSDPI
jgi:hypothetical protein